jgi:hypothetical protein
MAQETDPDRMLRLAQLLIFALDAARLGISLSRAKTDGNSSTPL